MKNSLLLALALIPLILIGQSFPTKKIQHKLDQSIDNKRIFGISLSISTENGTHHFASGNMKVGDTYFIASITKLYTAAVLFKLLDQQKLNLDDPIKQYLPTATLDKLHLYKGREYSSELTIRHLVTNTSGISDYFTQKNKHKESILKHLIAKGDTALTFDEIIAITKQLPAQFPPGTRGKAFYSDGNFQLLAKVIEQTTGKTMKENYEQFIFTPLNLKKTYIYNKSNDTTPKRFYYKNNVLDIPNMMISFHADGGIVSSSEENLIFLKAYLNQGIFSNQYVDLSTGWNKIYSPFQYGYGIMKFNFIGMPEMIGHAGASGSFAYYIPSKKVYITGTINQIDKPQLVYKLIAKILTTLKNKH